MRASGPWARGRPPVTVTLWKVSPEGARKKACGIRQREGAGGVGVGRDEALAELGQDDLERFAEAVEDADALLEGHDAFDALDVGLGGTLHAFGEGKVGLCVVGVDEEGGAAGDVGLQEMHACVGGVPALDDDVVELVAEELVDDALVLAVDFEEVGEGADGGHAVGVLLVGVGLEDVADGVGGVAVLADEGFERAAAAVQGWRLRRGAGRRGAWIGTLRRGGLQSASGGRRSRIRDA